jgi:hypothetical protein
MIELEPICECGSDAVYPEEKPTYCADCYAEVLESREMDAWEERDLC